MPSSQWLTDKKQFKAKQPGEALTKWLNQPDLNPENLIELLMHAQVVYRWMAEHPSPPKKKKPSEFWDSFQQVNETLASFSYARQLDLDDLADGNGVSWTLVAEDNRIVIPLPEVRWLVQLMEQRTILKIRRCKQCTSWFFARFSHQAFCKDACRVKHLTGSEKFKEKRRKYMRKYKKDQETKNVN